MTLPTPLTAGARTAFFRTLMLCMLIATAGLWASGCDGMLDIEPQGQQTSASFFTNADDADRALAGAYDAIQQQYEIPTYQGAPTFLSGYDMIFGEIASDNALKGGESQNDQPDIDDVQTFTVNSNNLYIAKMWSSLYEAVTRANRILNNVPEIEMDEAERADILAEARFIRAYANFYLLQAFGMDPATNNGPGIVLIEGEVTIGNANQPRSPEPEVWSSIEADLEAAAQELPTKSARGPSEYGRATTGAAKTLLVKAHVFQKDWSAAATLAQEVINSGEYSLADDFGGIFRASGEHGSGSIFEINYAQDTNEIEGYYGNVWQASRTTWGFGFKNPTQDLVDAFDSNDPRLDATIIFDGEVMPDGTTVSGESSRSGYHNEKIWIPQELYPQNQGVGLYEGPSNVRYLRLANLLLWHAEAANELGNTSAALESLNRVRERARQNADNPQGVLPDVTTTNQSELRDAIYRERRLELAMEDLRFFDLVRQGRAADVLGGNGFSAGTTSACPFRSAKLTSAKAPCSKTTAINRTASCCCPV